MTVDTIPPTWPVADYIATLRRHLPDLARHYHIKALGVFGSYIRNEQTPESDLDVLVEFDDTAHHGLLTVARIENEMSDMLGIKVDLVLRGGLRRVIGQRILEEVVWL
jgi:uncharacterized protein